MSVYLEFPGEVTEKLNDDEKAVYAYQVTDGGVLRVVVAEPDETSWTVLREYSPAGWSEVSGKRFTSDLDNLGGVLGGVAKRKSKTRSAQIY